MDLPNSSVPLVTHPPSLFIVVGCIHITLLLLLDDSHEFLSLHQGFVEYQALGEELLGQVIFVVGDVEVSK